MAKNVKDALVKEKDREVDAVFVDEDWLDESYKSELGYKKQ